MRAKLGDHVKQIVLFGSQARGDATEYSDYGFLVVVDTPPARLCAVCGDIDERGLICLQRT